MKKKGFTLVELLAVIVILAIIALIAIPLIGNVIEKAKKGALVSSVNGLVDSANMYYANNTIKGETISETTFDFEDGEQVSDKKLEYKGKVYNGKLILHANGEVAVCIDDEEHYAYKNKNTDEIVSGNGTCLYDGTTGDFSSNSSINDLRGKTLVATDISQSADGLSTLIKIPEEGHYDKNSVISVLNNNLGKEMIIKTINLGVGNINSNPNEGTVTQTIDVTNFDTLTFKSMTVSGAIQNFTAKITTDTGVTLFSSSAAAGASSYDISDYSSITFWVHSYTTGSDWGGIAFNDIAIK